MIWKLYRLYYSPYARKVQMMMDLLKLPYQVIEINFGERNELAQLTGGYVLVPVAVSPSGEVIVDSRMICQKLLETDAGSHLMPSGWEGPIWAYTDWCDQTLEDVLFRISTPHVRHQFQTPWEEALYVFVKERKFGKGCVEDWAARSEELKTTARKLLEPTFRTLAQRPFLFGDRPTLADAALYGQFAMLNTVPGLAESLIPAWPVWAKTLEAYAGI